MKQLRVLLIAEAANPELTSVALIGYSLGQAIGNICDAHLVTESRNAESLRRAGVPDASFTAIDNPLQRVAYRASSFLRGGTSLGWTINSAFSTMAYPLFERMVWRRFRKRLRDGHFDIVHRITPLSPITPSYLARKLAEIGVPFVLGPINGGLPWPPGYGHVRRAEREWLGYVRGFNRLFPGLSSTRKLSSAIVLASRHTYAEVTRNVPMLTKKAIWLPENAVDPDRFPEMHFQPQPPASGSPLRVAFLGRLVPYKGADVLLEAAAPLIREGRLTLAIIGDGPQMRELQMISAREGIEDGVEFAGWVPHEEVRGHLKTSHVFAFPSVREFGGGAVLEAMALGLAPIVLNYGGPAELVPTECGKVIPIGGRDELIKSFREALSFYCDEPGEAHATGIRAQQHVRANFTWEAKAAQLVKIYEWVIASALEPKPELFDPSSWDDPETGIVLS